MLQLHKISLRRICVECNFFERNSGQIFLCKSGMEDTSQIFLCKSGSRRRPASARDGNLTKIDYEAQVLNMVDEVVQDSQRKGNRHAAMLQQPTFMQYSSRSWTAGALTDKTSSDIRGRHLFEGLRGYASSKHRNTTTEKCVCGRVDRTPCSFLASHRTSTSPQKRRGGWEDVPSSLRERVYGGRSRWRCTPSPMQESPRSDRGSPAPHAHSSPPTKLHSTLHPVLTCCSTPPPQRHVRPPSPPPYATLLAAIASASPLRTRPRSRSQSAARRPSSRSCSRRSPDSHLPLAAIHDTHCSSRRQSPPPSQRSFHSRSAHLQEGSISSTLLLADDRPGLCELGCPQQCE